MSNTIRFNIKTSLANLRVLSVRICTVLAMLLLVATPQVSAFTEGDYYSTQNSTPFYDPSCANASTAPDANPADGGVECCNTTNPTTPSTGGGGKKANEIAIFDYLIGTLGFSEAQTYGIMGNMSIESGFNPKAYNPHTTTDNPDPSHAFGIAQWLGARQSALLHMSDTDPAHRPVTDLMLQLEYLKQELSHDGPLGYKSSTDTPIKAVTGNDDAAIAAAAHIWNDKYEGSGVADGPRIAAVQAIKADLAGHVPLTGPPTGPSIGDTPSAVCCPPDASAGTPAADDSSPSDWVKMYTGANAAKVNSMGRGLLGANPKILVIHYTQGDASGEDLLNFFVGTHVTGIQFNVGKDGKIYQYYPLNAMQKTNHVGDANAKSIGIEITGRDVEDLIDDDAQFQSVVALSKYLCDHYNIPCSEPKGDITGDGVDTAQGMLGHDETPGGGHLDPDAKVSGSTVENIPRNDSSKHPYMMKLRTAMGFDATPGHSGGSPTTPDTTTADTGAPVQCNGSGTTPDSTDPDPIGESANKALAMEAIKYGTAASGGKYKYVFGGLHGSVSQLRDFRDHGGGADCIGFVRYVIWKVYGTDISGMSTDGVPSSSNFQEVSADDVQAGDIGWRPTIPPQAGRPGQSGHVDFITKNLGGGKLHEFGAHSEETGIHGGSQTTSDYAKFYRFVGNKGTGN